MHHPARAAILDRLLPAVSRLAPRVVADPCPDGFASPLRTAKVAWAAIADGATHHMVLQDDLRFVDGFAERILELLAERPDRALSLYTSWQSPQNSYLVRLAAVLGAPLAPLSSREWTPTLGFVLPAARARQMADFLDEFPDEVRDDDWLVTTFCRQQGIPVAATVPSLVDHAVTPTLAGHPVQHCAVAFRPDRSLSPTHWAPTEVERPLATRAQLLGPRAFIVELVGSRCLLRLLDPARGEPAEHPFGWYWHDWSGLVGVEPDDIVAAFEEHQKQAQHTVDGLFPAIEVWAAGYLLGADAAGLAEDVPTSHVDRSTRADILRTAIVSLVVAGVRPMDLDRLGSAGQQRLVEIGLAAVAAGLGHPRGSDRERRVRSDDLSRVG